MKSSFALAMCGCLAVAFTAFSPALASAQSLQLNVVTNEGTSAHILPTERNASALRAQNATMRSTIGAGMSIAFRRPEVYARKSAQIRFAMMTGNRQRRERLIA